MFETDHSDGRARWQRVRSNQAIAESQFANWLICLTFLSWVYSSTNLKLTNTSWRRYKYKEMTYGKCLPQSACHSICSINVPFFPPFPLVSFLLVFASLLLQWTASNKMGSERFSSPKTFKFPDLQICAILFPVLKEKEFITWWTVRHAGMRGSYKKKESEKRLSLQKASKGLSYAAQSTCYACLLGKLSNIPQAFELHTTGSKLSPFQDIEQEKLGCFSLPWGKREGPSW